jgi:hypothetical protein
LAIFSRASSLLSNLGGDVTQQLDREPGCNSLFRWRMLDSQRGAPMEDINEFVDRQNLTRFRNHLENGVENGPARSLLLDLLVEQEKRFGMGQEQLDKVDRHIARLRQIIAGQVQLIDGLRAKGLSSDRARVVLDTLNDMMLVHQSFRETVVATASINREIADARLKLI